jgi:hypothetical protein
MSYSPLSQNKIHQWVVAELGVTLIKNQAKTRLIVATIFALPQTSRRTASATCNARQHAPTS